MLQIVRQEVSGMTSYILPKHQLSEDSISSLKGLLLGKEKFFNNSRVNLFFIHKKSKAKILMGNGCDKLYKKCVKDYYQGNLDTSEFRPILAPDNRRKAFLKALLEWCENNLSEQVTSSAHGFVKGKNIKTNAIEHINSQYALQIDLKDFFNQFSESHIKNYFKSIGVSHDWARLIAKLCTFNGSMFQGSPVSPFLANVFVNNMDKNISQYCKVKGLKYSRYADDITITSDHKMDYKVKKIILKIITKNKCRANMKKVFFQTNNLNITGITITNNQYKMPRKLKKVMKLMMKTNAWKDIQENGMETKEKHLPDGRVLERKQLIKDTSSEFIYKYKTPQDKFFYFVVSGLIAYKHLCENWTKEKTPPQQVDGMS